MGKGNTAEVFEYGEGKVCKLFHEAYPKEYVKLEFQNAQIMNKMPLPVPKVYEITERDNRTGIIYAITAGFFTAGVDRVCIL